MVFVFILCVFPCETIVRLSCVLYLLTVEKAESSFGASPAGVEYIRTVSLCSPLFRFVFLYSVPRLALRLAVASRPACVPFCVSFVRLALRAVSFVSPWRLFLRPVFIAYLRGTI